MKLPTGMMAIGMCGGCEHHRMDHDDGEYPEITFCHLCNCNKYSDRQ